MASKPTPSHASRSRQSSTKRITGGVAKKRTLDSYKKTPELDKGLGMRALDTSTPHLSKNRRWTGMSPQRSRPRNPVRKSVLKHMALEIKSVPSPEANIALAEEGPIAWPVLSSKDLHPSVSVSRNKVPISGALEVDYSQMGISSSDLNILLARHGEAINILCYQAFHGSATRRDLELGHPAVFSEEDWNDCLKSTCGTTARLLYDLSVFRSKACADTKLDLTPAFNKSDISTMGPCSNPTLTGSPVCRQSGPHPPQLNNVGISLEMPQRFEDRIDSEAALPGPPGSSFGLSVLPFVDCEDIFSLFNPTVEANTSKLISPSKENTTRPLSFAGGKVSSAISNIYDVLTSPFKIFQGITPNN